MRTRSQPASVWPARVSTPPGWAMSGKMCRLAQVLGARSPEATVRADGLWARS